MRRPNHRVVRSPLDRRGAIAVGMLLSLFFAFMLMTCLIVMDVHDADTFVNRIQAEDAFYAAEAGIQMAVREVMTGNDEDGDGGVGTISADANDATDPHLNGATFFVVRNTTGGQVTLESLGGLSACRKKIIIGVR